MKRLSTPTASTRKGTTSMMMSVAYECGVYPGQVEKTDGPDHCHQDHQHSQKTNDNLQIHLGREGGRERGTVSPTSRSLLAHTDDLSPQNKESKRN